MKSYSGWVPTITGQLSFSLVGTRLDGAYVANISHARSGVPHRTIAVVKDVYARDVIAPFRYFMPSRRATFILLGQTRSSVRPRVHDGSVYVEADEIGALEGRIYVVPGQESPLIDRAAREHVREIKQEVSRCEISSDHANMASVIESKIEEIAGISAAYSVVDFSLRRTGEVIITSNDDVDESILRQVYYYIKNCAHYHYHHHQSRDNILPLIETGDDIEWRRRTLWCLAKSVLESRRHNVIGQYRSAIGILAYADAFQDVMGRVYWDNTLNCYRFYSKNPIYDFKHTKLSIESLISQLESKSNGLRSEVSIFVALVVGFAACWISAVQIVDRACSVARPISTVVNDSCGNPPKIIANIIVFVNEYPQVFVLIIAVIFIWYFRNKIWMLKWVSKYDAYLRYIVLGMSADISRALSYVPVISRDRTAGLVLALLMGGAAVAALYQAYKLMENVIGSVF